MRARLFAAVFIVACMLHTSHAMACGIAVPAGQFARMSNEQTLVVWDDQKKIEHFIRKPVFDGDPSSFGFFVPTPVTPQVAKSDGAIFERLQALFEEPRIAKVGRDATMGGGAPGGGVQVMQTVHIDEFDLVSLKASDENALGDWLKKNGFVDRPELRAWSKSYIEKGFVINAMKYAGTKERKRAAIEPPTLRLSFATAGPFYPYSEPPEDASARTEYQRRYGGPISPRMLDVYIVARRPMQGLISERSGGPRPTKTMRITQLALASALGDTKGWLDPLSEKTWVVSHLHETTYARSGIEDVRFAAYDIPPPTPGPGVEGWVSPRIDEPSAPKSTHSRKKLWSAIALGLLLSLAVLFALRAQESKDAA